jgi:glutathione S-transferase
MENIAYPAVVSSLALLVYYFTLFKSGTARGRFKIDAPSHSGPPEYERIVRAHYNTLEQMAMFLPGLWLFAITVDPIWAAIVGMFWPPARLWYALGYYQSAEKRMPGLFASLPSQFILIVGSFIGGVMMLF